MSTTRLALIGTGIAGALFIGTLRPEPKAGTPAPPAAPVIVPAVAEEPALIPPDIQWGPLDKSFSVLQGSFTLINRNKVPIKDIVLDCDTRGASGTLIRQQRFVVYQSVPANGKRFVKDFTFGLWPPQGAKFACSTAFK